MTVKGGSGAFLISTLLLLFLSRRKINLMNEWIDKIISQIIMADELQISDKLGGVITQIVFFNSKKESSELISFSIYERTSYK